MADATQLKSMEAKIENIECELLNLRANVSKNRLELDQKITQMQQTLDKITQDLSQQTQILHKVMRLFTSPQSNQTFDATNSQQKETINRNDVSSRLARQILITEGDFVFSPISIQIMLSIAAVGSKGPTRDQLVSFLKANSVEQLIDSSFEIISDVFADGGGTTLSFANGVWVDRCVDLKQYFKRILDTTFKAESSQLDFQWKAAEATNEINAWVQKATNGLIRDLMPLGSLNSSTRLVLANALYFKGDWNQKFDSSSTKEQEFYLLNGSTIRVQFMTSWAKQFVAVFDDFKVLRLPYKQGLNKSHFSMCIFLPNAKDGLAALVDKMGTEPGFLDRYLPRFQVEMGCLAIPKFKILLDFDASKTLKELGLSSIFSGDGDLSEMVEYSHSFRVSKIHHKSFIDVTEEGTGRGVVVSTSLSLSAPMSSCKNDFVADHPFLFMMREDVSGVVLFIGQVLRPVQSGITRHCVNQQPQFSQNIPIFRGQGWEW